MATRHRSTELRRWSIESFAQSGLLEAFALDDGDVFIDGQFGKLFRFAAGLGPLHFQPLNFRPLTDAEDHSRVVRRQVTSATNFRSAALEVSRLIGKARANGVAVRFF